MTALSDSDLPIARQVKAALRTRMRALRAAAPEGACRARSHRVCAYLLSIEPLVRGASVALFAPIGDRHEVDIRGFGDALFSRGVRVVLPSMRRGWPELSFQVVRGWTELEDRGAGFLEPLETAERVPLAAIDAVVVPALAVDPKGYRVGYGLGCYDRALPLLAPRAVTVTVAYDYQLVAEVPREPHDICTSWVVTDARIIACGGGDAAWPNLPPSSSSSSPRS